MNRSLILDQFVFGRGMFTVLGAGFGATADEVSRTAEESACPRTGRHSARTSGIASRKRAMPTI